MVISTAINRLRKIFLAGVLFLICGLGNNARASHVAAADLYWNYVGTGPNDLTYEFVLVLFKACEPNNATLGTTASVSFSSISCGQSFFETMQQFGPPDTLDQLCANFAPVNACRVDTSVWPAFERRIYKKVVTMPAACVDWLASFSLCCRNQGIINLDNADSYSMYIEATMNNVAKYDNNSPRFIVDPIPYLCQNQPSFFLNGPLDPDNDSMVTINVQPKDNATAVIAYDPGPPYAYSLSDPIATAAANPYIVNPNTGTATFTPTLTGKFVLAFECADYLRQFPYTKLSTIRRDVQVSVLNCNASPPGISSTPGSGGTWTAEHIIACPGVPLTFNVTANSNTISNAVFLQANNLQVIPASTFVVANDGSPAPVGTFSWTPNGNDIGDYTIIFTAKDSTCNNNQPIVLKNYYVAFIKVLPGVDAGPDGRICKIDGTPWQLNVNGPSSAKYQWTALDGSAPIGLSNDTISNPTAYPPYNFTYVVTATNFSSACKNKDTVMVWIDTSNAVNIIPDAAVVCRPGYFQLDAEGLGLPPLQNLQCGTTDVVTCTVEDTLQVATQFAGGTPSASKVYSPYQGDRTARVQFLLTKDDLRAYGIRSATLRGLAFDVQGVSIPNTVQYNNFRISLKCTDREDLSAATGGVENGLTLVYQAPGIVTTPLGWNQFTFDMPYSVDSTKGLVVEICYSNLNTILPANLPSVNSVPTGSIQMAKVASAVNGANLCVNPSVTSTTTYNAARPIIRFNMCHAQTVPFDFRWYPGLFLSDSTIKNPLAYVNKDITYMVETMGRNGCKVQDTINIIVPVHNYDIWPKDTSFCIGGSFKMIGFGDWSTIKWHEVEDNGSFIAATDLDCDDCREPVATPEEDTRYAAIMTDVYGCSDTFFVKSIVKPAPIVNILNRDTTIKYGQSIQLLVSGAFLYSWSPLSTMSNPNISNPWASPTEPTTYHVIGLAENGCRNVDSVRINIDYRDNLFVPSAFTPNGDGKNDVFRVSNITFQKLQEFRVFNRWGQEIYSTNDPKKGWDGSWKGVPQDMGAYQYLIRVAYPDGYIETYKGDVTLIR